MDHGNGRNRTLGIEGEDSAADFLKSHGYQIIARNVRFRFGEIDIVARDKDVLCFVEVKLRNSSLRGSSAEAVGLKKQKKLGKLALLYLSRNYKSLDVLCRFDVVAVNADKGGQKIEVIKNAFELSV